MELWKHSFGTVGNSHWDLLTQIIWGQEILLLQTHLRETEPTYGRKVYHVQQCLLWLKTGDHLRHNTRCDHKKHCSYTWSLHAYRHILDAYEQWARFKWIQNCKVQMRCIIQQLIKHKFVPVKYWTFSSITAVICNQKNSNKCIL